MNIQEYQDMLEKEVLKAYEIAKKARSKLLDPSDKVEVLIATELASRVESLVSVVIPELKDSGLRERILELEDEYGKGAEKIGFIIAEEVANEKFAKFDSLEKKIEAGLRVGLAYWTLGIVTAPLEGITEVKIKKRRDGKDYLAIYIAGPMRSAGGTTNALLVLLADFLRRKFGLDAYDPTEEEIERYCIEVEDYHKRVTRLQYFPSKEEIKMIIKNTPVEINGDPTEKFEVLAYKDLDRVETNRIRGGMVLTISMIALKSSKLLKRIKKYGKEFDLEDWIWLEKLIELKEKGSSDSESKEEKKLPPFLHEIPGGRPVISGPNTPGGFRLRYGRSRNTGFAAVGMHPATLGVLKDFIAIGTQIKTELPGKAAVVVPVDSIEGPIVLLNNGDVVKPKTYEEAKAIRNKIKKILFNGDILIAYGEFLTNGHKLEPSGWVEEWWAAELEKEGVKVNDIFNVSFEDAIKYSLNYGVPLHPKYTYFWELLSGREVVILREKFSELEKVKHILEKLRVPHKVENGKIKLDETDRKVLEYVLSIGKDINVIGNIEELSGLDVINQISPVKIARKAGYYIGARMGRPEKVERRKMTGTPHVLFPAGRVDRERNIVNALKKGYKAELSLRICPKCGKTTYYLKCPKCGTKTVQRYVCQKCGAITNKKEHCGLPTKAYNEVFVKENIEEIAKKLNMQVPEVLKGVKGLSSDVKIPERLEKGLLRQKYDLYVNKDGTSRIDATDVPLTHFKPKEIGVSVEKLKELGYEKDIFGLPLESDEQIVELFPQDIILSDYEEFSAADYMVRIAKFIDELLVKVYGLEPYYNVEKKEDLLGKIVVGLAPHTSAGIVGRIIGFTKARVGFAHPAWHAAKKRNCDGDEDSVMLLLDALINFSREYLPSTRGGKTMDVPLVLTVKLDPLEVDSEVHDMDIVDKYPLELYIASQNREDPGKVKITTLESLLKTELKGIKYTHETTNIEDGPRITAYKFLGAMLQKVKAQLNMAELLVSVDENLVAEKILESHFLKDIKGNLRKFSLQSFRCVKCNESYRRIPLIGKCLKCGGKIVLKVHEGTIKKYLDPAKEIAKKYKVSRYIQNQLRLLEERIDQVFGKKSKQEGLDAWFAT